MRVTSRLWPRGDDGGGDARNLGGRLALSEHDLRKALTGRAMMVDLRKAEILDGPGQAGRAALGVRRIEPAVADRVEQRPERRQRARPILRAVLSRNLRECARRWAFALVTAVCLTPPGTLP